MNVTRTKCPYNVKSFKKSSFWEFWAIDKTWPTLDEFIILTFISENNRYFKCLYKFGTKLFHLT